MNSSGIKRGLAATAISALAVTGVPFLATTASATPLNNQSGGANNIELAAPEADISTKNDGQDTTVRLQAVAGANIASVRFEYSLGGAYTTIATVAARNDDGSFAYDWSAAGLDGASLTIRAVGLSSTGTTVDQDSLASNVDNTLDSVNIDNGSALGYFIQPYTGEGQTAQTAKATGTASDAGQSIDINMWDGAAFGTTVGTATSAVPQGGTVAEWDAVLDITGYDFSGAPDQLLLEADNGSTDDAEAYSLYSQTITTVTAEAEDTQIQSGDSTDVTVTVTDQNGNPIAGAQVFSSDGDGPEYTDGNGEATFTGVTAGSRYYYANATDSNPYEAELGDKRSESVTVSQYTPTETALAVTSRDGAAFDEDEFDYDPLVTSNSDITGKINDQNGNQIGEAGRTVSYRWVVTPFDGTPANTDAGQTDEGTVTTDGSGNFAIPAPVVTDDQGTWELYLTLEEDLFGEGGIAESKVLTVKNGDSTLAFDENEPEQATAGGEEVVSGSLTLADGTGLPGRSVLVSYNNGTNAYVVQSDATITNDTDRVVTTDANGNFSVTVKDPSATPQPTEDGDVTAVTQDQAEPDAAADVDNPGESAGPQDVQFLATTTPGALTLTDEDYSGSGAIRPGELEEYTVHVTDGATPGPATDLSNQEVTLTTDHGYFTDGTPAPAPVVGQDAGTYKDLGQSTTVMTDENGEATIFLAMKRDEGFDDDGAVTSHVTATINSLSDSEDQAWTSANPLNGSEVRLEFSPADEQESDNLPEAQVGQRVYFDVFAEDQFGNLVGDEEVTLTDNAQDAAIVSDDDDDNTAPVEVLTDFDNDGDVYATSEEEQDQTITATWVEDNYVYTSTVGDGNPGTTGNDTFTDSQTINWYDVDLAAATLTLTSNPEGPVKVGTAVTETLTAVDENGNPIEGLEVQFIRSGPGSQPGETVTKFTNAQGQAFYTFVGEQRGTASINVAVSDGDEVQTLTDTVEFTAKIPAALTLRGGDNGAADDSLLANAINKTAGAEVKLFRKRANGTWKKIATGVMNDKGNFRFRNVADLNGNGKTRYKAIVAATDETKRGIGKKTVR